MGMRLPALVLLVLVCALGAARTAFADQQLSQEQQPFVAAAFGETIAWSSFDSATKDYRLMSFAGGVRTALTVAPRPQAFDVSVGPGEDGSPVAVYSRCTGQTPPLYTFGGAAHTSSGCDIYRYDVASGSERKVTSVSSTRFSETQPSIRGRRLAFVRTLAARRGRPARDAVYIGRTTGDARARRQPTPASRHGGQVEGVSLTAKGLFFVWRRFERNRPVSHPILTRVVHRRAREIDRIGSGGAAYGQILAPSVLGTRVYYGRVVLGRGRIWRYSLRDRSFAVGRRIQGDAVVAREGGRFLLSNWLDDGICSGNVNDPPSASMCTLTLTDPVAFTPHRKPHGEQT
jgi:hypothetical protein